jgi:hypothetical protein
MVPFARTALTAIAVFSASHVMALSMAADELHASRQMACVLAQESLGQLSEQQYGERTHNVLDGYNEKERDTILAKALGYYDGLMFALPDDDSDKVRNRLLDFVDSSTCSDTGFQHVTFEL